MAVIGGKLTRGGKLAFGMLLPICSVLNVKRVSPRHLTISSVDKSMYGMQMI